MKKGQVTFYVTFVIMAIMLVVTAAVLVPMGIKVNSETYVMGELMLLDANSTISGIQDANVRESIQNSIGGAAGASQTNIEMNADIFKYSWVILLILFGLVIFMYVLRIKEISGQGMV